MSNPPTLPNDAPQPGYSNSSEFWPFEFRAHYIGVHGFDVQSYKITYRGWVYDSEGPRPSVASYGRPLDELLSASRGPIPNFPPPATVEWTSLDGAKLYAEVDIGEIFKDQLVRHDVAREDVGEFANDTAPGIILEVNDRTINVYMRAMIWTKEEQVPGNKHSRYRDDLIKVFTRTY